MKRILQSSFFDLWMEKIGKVDLASLLEKIYNEAMDEKIRINKFLSEAGFCSRREADSLIQAGRVTVDGHRAEPGEKITEHAQVLVDGKPVQKVEEKVLLLFYKPRGVVCSTKQQRQEMTVTEYLDYPVRIYPVGRLDKESEGLLLLTNQGDLVNKIMRAGNYHEKEYLVTVDRPVDDSFVKKMSSGVPILDTVTRPCFVEKTGKKSFRIILTQGLNRQIRRMCEYLGYQVLTLKRVRIMELTLDGLKEGQYRDATAEEWKMLERGLVDSSQLPASCRKTNATRNLNEIKTGGHHGKFSTANERTGRNFERSRKGVLPAGQGNHEQSGVRQSVRSAGTAGKRNRHRPHK